jgi:hypothetical protein
VLGPLPSESVCLGATQRPCPVLSAVAVERVHDVGDHGPPTTQFTMSNVSRVRGPNGLYSYPGACQGARAIGRHARRWRPTRQTIHWPISDGRTITSMPPLSRQRDTIDNQSGIRRTRGMSGCQVIGADGLLPWILTVDETAMIGMADEKGLQQTIDEHSANARTAASRSPPRSAVLPPVLHTAVDHARYRRPRLRNVRGLKSRCRAHSGSASPRSHAYRASP